MLDRDLGELYEVETRTLVQAVKRNQDRFPSDFMFRLSDEEFRHLRSQLVISSWGGRRYQPYAFTEQGVAMLSSVLRSERAAVVNIAIMRTFVRLRRILTTDALLSRKLDELEGKFDRQFQVVFKAIRELMAPDPRPTNRRIGFAAENEERISAPTATMRITIDSWGSSRNDQVRLARK